MHIGFNVGAITTPSESLTDQISEYMMTRAGP